MCIVCVYSVLLIERLSFHYSFITDMVSDERLSQAVDVVSNI